MIPWTMASDPMKRLRGSPSFYGVVATLLLVVFVAAALFFARAIRVEEQEHLAQNDAIARSVAASIEAATLRAMARSEEHTPELQPRGHLLCRLLLEKKNTNDTYMIPNSQ